jgi:hypothetical protein
MAVLVAGCTLLPAPGPTDHIRNGWVWPTAAPLPPAAIAVPIDVAQPFDIPPDADFVGGCPLALLGPLTPEYRAGQEPPVGYRVEGKEVRVRWPVGFSARLSPALEIVAPDGKVVARAGEITDGLIGGHLDSDAAFTVCFTTYGPKRLGASG